MVITCLRARVEESAGRLDGHRGQGAVGDLGARVAAAPRARELVRLARLTAEVAASDHLLGGRLATEAARDQDLLGRRLAPNRRRLRRRVA